MPLVVVGFPAIDLVLNTPSNHRVHHHLRAGGARHNYGANFMIWDHRFGTYQKEVERKPYGADLGDLGPDPIRVQLEGLRRLVAGTLRP